MLKKAFLSDENRNQIKHRMGFLQFYDKTKKVCSCFASFSSEQEDFTPGMYMTPLIRPSEVKIQPIMFYVGINAKVFRPSITFAIVVVVTTRSSSFEYTISVHAVHAGAERNMCNIVVSTETPQLPPIHLKRCSPCTN